MPYLFKCPNSTGQLYIFGLVPGLRVDLTNELHFQPKPTWFLEAHIRDQFSGLTCKDFGDGSIWGHTERMVVLFKDKHAQCAYVWAERSAVEDDRFNKDNLQVHYFVGHSNERGIITESAKYSDLVSPDARSSIQTRNLARWAHQSK